MDKWNRTESPEVNPHTYNQLIFEKGSNNVQWEKDSLFIKWWLESWTIGKSVKLEHILTPYTKINWKWLKDVNKNHGTIKLLEEGIAKVFLEINGISIFLV